MAGFNLTAAFEREATIFNKTWPSTSPAEPTQLIPVLSESINITQDQRAITTRNSHPATNPLKTLRRRVDGNLSVTASFEDLEFFLTCILGLEPHRIDGTLMPEEIVEDEVYRHIIELDDDIWANGWAPGSGFIPGDADPDGDNLIPGQKKMRRGTITMTKGGAEWRILSAMLSGLSMTSQANGDVAFTASVLGHSITYNDTVGTSPSTLSCSHEKLISQTMTLTMLVNDLPFILNVSDFSLNIGNPLRPLYTRDSGIDIEEPRRNGSVPVTGSFTIPHLSFTSFQDINLEQDTVAFHISYGGRNIPGTGEFYEFNIYLPSVQISGYDADINSAGHINQSISFVAGKPTTYPSSFPTRTMLNGSVIIEIFNTNPNHSLLS